MLKLSELSQYETIIVDGDTQAYLVKEFVELGETNKKKMWLAELKNIRVDESDVFNFIENHLEMKNIDTDEVRVRDYFCKSDLENIAGIINSLLKDIPIYEKDEEIEDDRVF